jgi:hypothetical protein
MEMKHISVVFTLVFSIFLTAVLVSASESDYDNKIEVETIVFEWKVDCDVIHIRLSAKTDGWVGIGFNPSEQMKDANFILGYVKDGDVNVSDHFGSADRQHEKDEKLGGTDDVTNISGKEVNGITQVCFTIPMHSKDSNDQALSADKETKVLLAYGAGRDSFRARHQFRTALNVNLKTGKFTKIK